ncbi:MAG: hypothetical protein AB1756_06765 [Acidobacteriota bacterium]
MGEYFIPYGRVLIAVFLAMIFHLACEKADPVLKVLQERRQYEVKVLSWAVMEGKTIAATINITGPMRSSLKYISIKFEQYDEDRNIIKSEWIPFELLELKGIGSKDFMLTMECGSPAVTLLTAKVEYDPSPEDRKHLRELQELFSR